MPVCAVMLAETNCLLEMLSIVFTIMAEGANKDGVELITQQRKNNLTTYSDAYRNGHLSGVQGR